LSLTRVLLFLAATLLLALSFLALPLLVSTPASHSSAAHSTLTLPIPVYAPLSAPPLDSLSLLLDPSCAPAAPCPVTLTAHLSTPSFSPLTYTFKFFDRCTSHTTDLPGSTLTFPAFTTIVSTTSLTLPPFHQAALVALTTSPALVTSPPLLLGSNNCP
jgi:hypothetical protein